MSLTEQVVEVCEYSSVVKTDAGCTPKLPGKRTVASECSTNVVELLSKRTMSLSRRSSSSSSWLCAVKKSGRTVKQVVENRRKACSQLQFDSTLFNEMVKYGGFHPPADNMHMVIDSSQSEATSLYNENKMTSSHAHIQVPISN